jgi:hypothetical protein
MTDGKGRAMTDMKIFLRLLALIIFLAFLLICITPVLLLALPVLFTTSLIGTLKVTAMRLRIRFLSMKSASLEKCRHGLQAKPQKQAGKAGEVNYA